jgi:hypothetical protein
MIGGISPTVPESRSGSVIGCRVFTSGSDQRRRVLLKIASQLVSDRFPKGETVLSLLCLGGCPWLLR